ncbi:cyanoexosortase B [Leptolyngbya sp. 'hensonii']|uniref:cyanoexosortase B n=1 Tax=Leptolyngbya sp. 'hensonii' TaxID=1922337 RepID=UPI00094FF79E|nr:cyanoexosortase B [Leptolyngbya sp. 'hensonii']OLP17802.1 cyanoexosortase B [Leptolyngbya sp. 'hensonii']
MHVGRKIPISIERYLMDGAIVALLLLLYAPLIIHWYDGWLNKSISLEHEYFSHGIIGFPFAAYICWLNRDRWQALPQRSSPIGLGLMALGAVFYLSSLSNLVNLSLPIVLAGLCLWLKGLSGLKLQAFSLLLVFLATPTSMPYLIEPYTFPLQRFIAGMAGFILHQLRLDVTVRDIALYVGDRIVEVAPHCAGLKMLFTSLYVGLMLLFWREDLHSRARVTLFLVSTALMSVLANIIRNTLLTFMHGTGRDSLFAWFHDSWGGDLYSACMLLLLIPILIGIERLFPDPVPDQS